MKAHDRKTRLEQRPKKSGVARDSAKKGSGAAATSNKPKGDRGAKAQATQRPLELTADVVVFGAGISGLTVAHELMERNFRVVVIDPSIVPLDERRSGFENANPGLGGIAKSQWCYFPVAEDNAPRPPLSDAPMRSALSLPSWRPLRVEYTRKGETVHFGRTSDVETGKARDSVQNELAALGAFLTSAKNADPPVTFSVVCRSQKIPPARPVRDRIAALLQNAIAETAPRNGTKPEIDFIQIVTSQSVPTDAVEIELNCFSLPGEHGFRFFPSFYRHVFDTMKRIPLSQHVEGHDNRSGTVFDNLIATTEFGYVTKRKTPSIRVGQLRSMDDARKVIDGLIEEAGYTKEDLGMLGGAFLKYMTSSRMRREKEYENVSWFEFVEGDRYSPRAQYLHETAPGTLLGVFGSAADARSQGTIAMQLARIPNGDATASDSDMLLNGPTDLAWFAHWFEYLDTEAVGFECGELKKIDANGTPVVVIKQDGVEREATFAPSASIMNGLTRYVVALPLRQATEIAIGLENALKDAGKSLAVAKDFAQLLEFVGRPDFEEELAKPCPEGPLRHLSGIQYFFDQDVRMWRGHTQYLDAPFGLSSVSQPQFWKIPETFASGYRTVLSVDIGIWEKPTIRGDEVEETVYGWNRSREFLATEIWKQIEFQHKGDFPNAWPRLATPYAYHVDDNLVLDDKGNIVTNKSPFLVNEKGQYRLRPGLVGLDDDWRAIIRYDVAFGRCVMAGTHMQTSTRITSMEAACESGRRAVNALLEHLALSGEPCSVWDPEDYEPSAFDQFKKIDQELCERGCPHPLDIIRT